MSAKRSGFAGASALAACLVGVACATARQPTPSEGGPSIVFPSSFGEGEEQDAGAKPAEPPAPATRSTAPPDPEPLRQAEQYEFSFEYDTGVTRVSKVRALKFPSPVVTARKMGRFAVELWVGAELVERVRFDFPLLAAEDPPPKKRRPLSDPPSLAGGTLRATVLVPAAWRARRAVLVDRGTRRELEIEWPPNFADAGTPDAAAPSTSQKP